MKRHTKLHLNRILYQSIKSERFLKLQLIVSLSKHTFTPFHLGLAIQLHHEFGSRRLVDNLNSHGFCASYSEVRRFLTRVALKEEESIKEGVLCPRWHCSRLSRWMSHTRGCWQYRYQYRDNRWQGHFPFYGKGSLSSMIITYRLMYATGVYQKEQR